MNTVAKGNTLEAEVFDLFQRIIDEGDFYAQKQFCRLKKKPRYYSNIHGREIEFDLGIEIWMPGASEASFIILIECKDYASNVPGSDLAEFMFNCEAVGAHKGIVVSRGAFQKGALNIAQNKRLGLIRYFGADRHKWILHRSSGANVVLAKADERIRLSQLMTEEVFLPPVIDVVCETMLGATASLWEFFDDLVGTENREEWLTARNPSKNFGGVVPYIEATHLEQLANEIGSLFEIDGGQVDLERLCIHERERCGLKVLQYEANNTNGIAESVLVRFLFSEQTIELFAAHARSKTQLRFTLAHELGHHFLGHSQFMALDTCDDDDVEHRSLPLVGLTDIGRLEWQANRFAGALLMPKGAFLHHFRLLLEKLNVKNRGHGVLYVDGQQCNLQSFGLICSDLGKRFDVSFGAVATRLQILGLLNDRRLTSETTSPASPCSP
jgi:Zn-dependent peptidase ImmA (M78 family)